MKTMKIYLLAAAAALLGACSLEETPEFFVNRSNFYRNRSECIAGLNSCYIPLKTIYNFNFGVMTEGVTDLLYHNSPTVYDSRLEISPALPGYGATVWSQCYKAVMYCNAAIEGIRGARVSEDDRARLLAEGMILRAMYYYLLTSVFGDVPFYTVDVCTEELLNQTARLPRMPAVDTRDYLIEELMTHVPVLDQVRASEIADNRMGAAAGWMLAAKMAMWNKRWDTALEALGELEKIYGPLDRYPLADIPFRFKNTPESIFEIQHTYTAGGLIYTSNYACICMPNQSTEESGTNVYDGVVIEELGDDANVWPGMRPNLVFSAGLQTRTGGDLRAPLNLAWEYGGNEFKGVGTRPWLGPKFWCPGMRDSYDSNNYKVFRYADAVLMMAECWCMKENLEKTKYYLNQVKDRAGIAPFTLFRSWERTLEEIRNERARELIGEFQRKFDLVRWGIWYTKTLESADYETVRNAILPCHEYYPIPDTQVVYSGYALDNRAYEKYGL